MKLAYAFRRATLFPSYGTGLPEGHSRPLFLKKTKHMGFDGIEIGLESLPNPPTEPAARELRRQLDDAGLVCAAIRGGGGLIAPRTASSNRQRLEQAVSVASWLGAGVVNTTVTTPVSATDDPGGFVGQPVSQGSSRTAREEDFERTACGLREIAAIAEGQGVAISIEVHQHSIADSSWSTLHLLDLVDRPNVGVNPDLGNIYWAYDIPEESCEAAILALAPRARYWHCKNLTRVHVPEVRKAIFLQTSLPDGDIDYRFALFAMLQAGYQGYLAIEGVRLGDQFHADAASIAYVKQLLEEHSRGTK